MKLIFRSSLVVLALYVICASSEAKEGSSYRTLHYIKDVSFTRESLSAKIVLSFDSNVSYRILERRQGREGKKFTIIIENCVVNPRIERIQPDKTFIRSIHIANKYTGRSGTSVIVNIISSREVEFNSRELSNPFRIIVTMAKKKTSPEKPSPYMAETSKEKSPPPATAVAKPVEVERATEPPVAESLSNLRLIVIDPGHGGRDKGATGWGGIYEKDLTLMLARSLKKIIEEKVGGVKVELTRYKDEYLSLDQRVKIANSLKADLFISLHFNAHENSSVRGIETYYLNISQDKEAARVAAIENAVLNKRMTDLEAILQDLLKASSIAESAKLARAVHTQIIGSLKSLAPDIRDLGVKSAPFYVLFGTTMPGFLIEAGFISNREELEMIRSSQFAQAIAKGITEGVKLYTASVAGKSYKTLQNGETTKGLIKNREPDISKEYYHYVP